MSIRRASGLSAFVCGVALVGCVAAPVSAQDDPNPGAITIAGAFDVTNAYMFRGIPQDESGVIMWPAFDLGVALRSSDSGLRSLGVNFGTWNSLHTGNAGLDGPSEQLWYESDFYATLGFGFGGGVSASATYTAYTSPNGMFTTVKELSFKVGADDSAYLGRFAVKPYAIVAFELDTEPFMGQADGGLESGQYLELGAAPGFGWAAGGGSVAFPVKVGLSLADYYETVSLDPNGDPISTDDTFGFFSVAGIVTVPFSTMPTRFGTWNVHGGVEYQRLGERNGLILDAINDATGETEQDQFIISVGIGFSY
jgi:hypothetical protein